MADETHPPRRPPDAPAEQSCGSCRYFGVTEESGPGAVPAGGGRCFRYPPTVPYPAGTVYETNSGFPFMYPGDYCGEFKAKQVARKKGKPRGG